jgi:hypothetical protein
MSSFLLANAVLLTLDSATRSGYVISEPEVEHEPECPFAEHDEENDEEDEDLEEDEVVMPPRTSCACKVIGYDIVETGLVTTAEQRQDVAESAVESAVSLGIPLIVVREHWSRHGLSNAAFESLLMNAGKWNQALELAGAHMDMVITALPDTWRRPLFGSLKGMKRPQLKQRAKLHVAQVMKLPPYSEDICEALCIRDWGSRADEVHALLKGAAA